MEPDGDGVWLDMPKTEVLVLRVSPEGNCQPQSVPFRPNCFPQERVMYSVIEIHELQTARVENDGQVQLPVGQSTGRAAVGSEAENMPL